MTTMEQGDDCLPRFFRVYLADESGDDLELPISFNNFLPKSLPKTVTVRSLYGKIWRMALRKCVGDVEKYLLVDGWKRIAKDEDLKGGDFLAFEFDGSRCFNFCVYEGRTMCKRLRRCSERTIEISEKSNNEDETGASEDVRVPDSDDDDDDDYEDADYDSVDDEVDDVDNDMNEDDDDDVVKIDPSFTVTLNPKKKSQLLIPTRLIKDYNLTFSDNITIVDPLAKKFGTLKRKIKIQTNGSVYVKGFGSIVRRNNVKTTDKMIFELKTANHNLVQTIELQVISG